MFMNMSSPGLDLTPGPCPCVGAKQSQLSGVPEHVYSIPDSTSHADAFVTKNATLLWVRATPSELGRVQRPPNPIPHASSLLAPHAQGPPFGSGGWVCPEEGKGRWVGARSPALGYGSCDTLGWLPSLSRFTFSSEHSGSQSWLESLAELQKTTMPGPKARPIK